MSLVLLVFPFRVSNVAVAFLSRFFFSRLLRTRRFLKVTSLALGGSLDAFEGCAVLFTKTLGCGASVW